MAGISIRLEGPALEKVAALMKTAAGAERVMGLVGEVGVMHLQSHFRALNSKHPNKLGGNRTNFWNQVAASTAVKLVAKKRVEIGIAHPAIAQKVYGGTITAKRTKYLTIPLDPLAYGVGAKNLPFATELRIYGGKKFIVRAADGKPMYVLKKSVTQAAQKDALPSMLSLAAKVDAALLDAYGL